MYLLTKGFGEIGDPTYILLVYTQTSCCFYSVVYCVYCLHSSDQGLAGSFVLAQKRLRQLLRSPIRARSGVGATEAAERGGEGGRMGGKTAAHSIREHHH